MIGSTVTLTVGFVVADTTARARFVTALIAALGLWAGRHRPGRLLMSYFAKINYALVVFAVTVGVTQFYAQGGRAHQRGPRNQSGGDRGGCGMRDRSWAHRVSPAHGQRRQAGAHQLLRALADVPAA